MDSVSGLSASGPIHGLAARSAGCGTGVSFPGQIEKRAAVMVRGNCPVDI